MCSVRSKTKIRIAKSLSKYSFNTYFVFMIYFSRLRQIEIFNSYCSFDKSFAKFYILNVNFSSFFIQKSMNKSKKSTKTLRDNCNNIAIICKTIEIFEYSLQNSLTTMRFLQRRIFFFVNQKFQFRMSFSFDFILYTITKKRLLIVKAKDIIDTIQNILNYVRNHAKMIQKRMTTQINKRRKIVKYIEKNFVFLNRRNIKIVKSFDKFDDKKLNSFKMIQRLNNVYRFELFEILRIHDMFHCWFLRQNFCDFLENQINEFSNSILINENFK